MDIRLSRESGIPLRLQLGRQIAYLISTGQLKPGEALPSVRALAIRLKIHYNTVSQAYQDLVDYHLVESRRGSRTVVMSLGNGSERTPNPDLDDVINSAIRLAHEHGFSLQQLRQRVRERLLAEDPDHLLVVEEEPGMSRLIQAELSQLLCRTVAACTVGELTANRGLAIGALVVVLPRTLSATTPLLPKNRPPAPLILSKAEQDVEMVKNLPTPSTIAVVSVSDTFLQTARGLLAPALGERHTLREFLLPSEKPVSLAPFALTFCDSIARRSVKGKNVVVYRLISDQSVKEITQALGS